MLLCKSALCDVTVAVGTSPNRLVPNMSHNKSSMFAEKTRCIIEEANRGLSVLFS